MDGSESLIHSTSVLRGKFRSFKWQIQSTWSTFEWYFNLPEHYVYSRARITTRFLVTTDLSIISFFQPLVEPIIRIYLLS